MKTNHCDPPQKPPPRPHPHPARGRSWLCLKIDQEFQQQNLDNPAVFVILLESVLSCALFWWTKHKL